MKKNFTVWGIGVYTSCCKCSTSYEHISQPPFWHTWTCEKCGQVNHSISGNFTNETIVEKLNKVDEKE